MDFSLLLDQMSDITTKYIANKQNVSEIGFNIFTIVSDLYYRENFHSDIIQSFLDPDGEHGEGYLFLNLFLELLPKIDKCNFKEATVIKEFAANYKGKEGRIDILIKDDTTRKAIIIENKIHDANNMSNQIPRYYYSLKSKGYDVEAIVYIPLDKFKNPYEGWENSDEKIKNLITVIPAYDYDSFNLVDNWIIPCSKANVASQEVKYVLQQYSKLIKFLYTNAMDTKALEDFYQNLKSGDNYNELLTLQDLLNQMPDFLIKRLKLRYQDNERCKPFEGSGLERKYCVAFYNANISEQFINMNVSYENGFWISLFVVERTQDKQDIKKTLSKVISLQDFDYDDSLFGISKKMFSPIQEDELFEFIDGLLQELTQL